MINKSKKILDVEETNDELIWALSRIEQKLIAYDQFKKELEKRPVKKYKLASHNIDDKEEYAKDMIEFIRLGRKSGHYSENEYFFFIKFYIENIIHENRWLNGKYKRKLDPISNKMKEVEKAHGLSDDEFWLLEDAPEDYKNLANEYDKVMIDYLVATYREFGEDRIVNMLLEEPELFEKKCEFGGKSTADESDIKLEYLEHLLHEYKSDSEKSAKSGAYFGACSILGAVLETKLLILCIRKSDEVKNVIRNLPKKHRPRNNLPESWTLNTLFLIANAAGWLPSMNFNNRVLEISENGVSIQHLLLYH